MTTDRVILSKKPEDNIVAMEWGIKQGELMRKEACKWILR